MKKFLFLFVILFFLVGCSNNNSSNNISNTSNYSTDELSLTINNDKKEEEQISEFSTKILNSDEDRQKNIRIACDTLNGTVVKSGETFSFCDTLGQATPEKGYEKADIFDSDGDVISGYGGGKCQISSTLYNAVLNMDNIDIVERHPHSGAVDYVEKRERCCDCLW